MEFSLGQIGTFIAVLGGVLYKTIFNKYNWSGWKATLLYFSVIVAISAFFHIYNYKISFGKMTQKTAVQLIQQLHQLEPLKEVEFQHVWFKKTSKDTFNHDYDIFSYFDDSNHTRYDVQMKATCSLKGTCKTDISKVMILESTNRFNTHNNYSVYNKRTCSDFLVKYTLSQELQTLTKSHFDKLSHIENHHFDYNISHTSIDNYIEDSSTNTFSTGECKATLHILLNAHINPEHQKLLKITQNPIFDSVYIDSQGIAISSKFTYNVTNNQNSIDVIPQFFKPMDKKVYIKKIIDNMVEKTKKEHIQYSSRGLSEKALKEQEKSLTINKDCVNGLREVLQKHTKEVYTPEVYKTYISKEIINQKEVDKGMPPRYKSLEKQKRIKAKRKIYLREPSTIKKVPCNI